MPKDHAAMLTGMSPAANQLGSGIFKMPNPSGKPNGTQFNEVSAGIRMIG